MSANRLRSVPQQVSERIFGKGRRAAIPGTSVTILLACLIGVLAGCGAVVFTLLIHGVSAISVEAVVLRSVESPAWLVALCFVPAAGLLVVAWFTRRFAPEAQGHGVPEVITAVGRRDGIIRPRVSLVKILASGICIGTGGSVGREGPIVQIGSSLGSVAGQLCGLSPRHIKVLVAAGAAAGISATFHAPLAGVIFASEIILGSFAAESLTPIVIASVVADVVQVHVGEHGANPAFQQLHYVYLGSWSQLPMYFALGLVAGLGAVSFTKALYAIEDLGNRWIRRWWLRALVAGLLVGVVGVVYPWSPPAVSGEAAHDGTPLPPLFGVGYAVVDHAVHLEAGASTGQGGLQLQDQRPETDKSVWLNRDMLWKQLWWMLPLVVLKPLLTSITLSGGGSGGIFAPSLFLGATLGASFGLVCNLAFPELSANPGVFAIVGMGAVVAGTTHGVLSAILIVYELTNDYRIILPIMAAAGLSSVVAKMIDPESIYEKKLSRRGEHIARSHDTHQLEHIMVRDVMIQRFPTVRHTDNLDEIVRIARANPSIESLPVLNEEGKLTGIIRPIDLYRVLDTDVAPHLVNAYDIALVTPLSVSPDENLLEALRDFGTRDVETLPVEVGQGESRRLVGLLLRSDVMRRYREELLKA